METTLTAEIRGERGKGPAHRLRAAGRIPAILYGHGMEPVSIHVSAQELLHLFHQFGGTNVLVDLKVGKDTHLAIAREVQRDHIHSRFVHVDFLAVRRDERIKVSVEVYEVGDSVGIREGGVVEHHLRDIEVECLPGDVPERLEADITELHIGDMLHVRDVRVPDGVTFLSDPETPVISIITPAALRVEADLTLPGEEAPVAEEAPEEAPAAEEAPAGEVPAAEEPAPEE